MPLGNRNALLLATVAAASALSSSRWGLPAFSAHMFAHMLLVTAVPALIVLGIRGSRVDWVRWDSRLGCPIVASMVELLLVWAWHVPALHHAAGSHLWAWAAEQVSFLLSGLFLWGAVLGGEPAARRARALRSIAGLLLTSMHMTLLGALITLSHRPLLIDPQAAHPWISPLGDQQLGGALMLIISNVAYLSAALGLAHRALRGPREVRV